MTAHKVIEAHLKINSTFIRPRIWNQIMIRKTSLLACLLALVGQSFAQVTYPVNGVHHQAQNAHVFSNATIVVDSATTIENATMVVRDGRIVAVGVKIPVPADAIEHDMEGKYIYPSFVDAYTSYGMPEVKRAEWTGRPQFESKKEGAFHWNQAIHPESRAIEEFKHDRKSAAKWVNNGFGTVVTHKPDGIMRGNSLVTTLGWKKENETVIKTDAAAHLSFNKGSSGQNYPSSMMGSIALLRQTYYDANWNHAHNAERNSSLDAVVHWIDLPQVFAVSNKLNLLRADKVGDEFGVQYIFKTNGDEYQRINEVKASGASLIVPVNFPKAYDVEDAYDALNVSLADMKHWEMAPSNPYRLAAADIPFVFTMSGLKDGKSFIPNVRKAIQHGLTESQALDALTMGPARMFGVDDEIGSLEAGKQANFLICSGNIFESGKIREHWINGDQKVFKSEPAFDVRGEYNINFDNNKYPLKVTGTPRAPEGSTTVIRPVPADTSVVENEETKMMDTVITAATIDTVEVKTKISITDNVISISFSPYDGIYDGPVRASGTINYDSGSWDGNAEMPGGKWIKWSAIRSKKHEEKEKKSKPLMAAAPTGDLFYPNMAYGNTALPEAKNMLIQNATVWTSDEKGVLKNCDVLIVDGKISAVGNGIDVSNITDLVTIDGTGKHLTAGLIDEHSHIAINGVNEGSQAVTAEVRIGDVIDSDDINIYRQLSGGTTTSQLLHGSANPVGGQSAIVKLRWGHSPEAMKFGAKDGFIKFALGENVKQSNWGDFNRVRFPQTRMGVEQVYYDAFIRAREYGDEWKAYNALPKKQKAKTLAPRRDLELDAMLEILESKRFITCHSYVQSEINMLMHVADSMGFRINTFTHILEGYKLADKMAAHGAGGSTFSDWWAYKFEVNDAIPYNAALMHNQGIVVAINSDDAEMGRRLNQEAAKGVKYGGMSEEDALKMVTLNPAKLLHIDERVGSITVGKDADVVLWSDHPLSVYAVCEKTIIDGTVYFDIETQEEVQATMAAERSRLIQKMIDAKNGGEGTQRAYPKRRKLYHCDTLEGEHDHEEH